jgi:hypothetical protein
MKNLFLSSPLLCVASLGVVCQAQPSQQRPDEGFKFIAAAQHQYDSNFARVASNFGEDPVNPEIGHDEQITRAALGIGYNKSISNQRLGVRFTANQYSYAERDYLDEHSFEGSANWRSQFSRNFSTQLNYERTELPVDQLEFRGRDLVANDKAKVQLSLGDSRRLGFVVGAIQTDQTHSNEDRQYLDFQDQDVFAEVRYKGLASSWVSLRYRKGDRDYEWVELLPRDLNFDYEQWEIETSWALSPKAELSGIAGYFEREGATNDDEGALAGLTFSWQTTPKIATEVSYTYSQPAQGETSDSPAEVSVASLMVRWQWTTKILVSAGGSYSEYEYVNEREYSPYGERNLSLTPLTVEWVFSEALRFRLSSQWYERHSPDVIRDFDGHVITGGLGLVF